MHLTLCERSSCNSPNLRPPRAHSPSVLILEIPPRACLTQSATLLCRASVHSTQHLLTAVNRWGRARGCRKHPDLRICTWEYWNGVGRGGGARAPSRGGAAASDCRRQLPLGALAAAVQDKVCAGPRGHRGLWFCASSLRLLPCCGKHGPVSGAAPPFRPRPTFQGAPHPLAAAGTHAGSLSWAVLPRLAPPPGQSSRPRPPHAQATASTH